MNECTIALGQGVGDKFIQVRVDLNDFVVFQTLSLLPKLQSGSDVRIEELRRNRVNNLEMNVLRKIENELLTLNRNCLFMAFSLL